jgi:YbbR domain-containing protein
MRFLNLPNNSPSEEKQTKKPAPEPFEGRRIIVKVLAFLIASTLWLYVMNEQNPPIEARYTIPLEIRNVQVNYVVVDSPSDIRVRLRGPRTLIAGTSSNDITAYVDMTNLSEGGHMVNIRSVIPTPLELIENTPETVIVRLEPIISRTMPVTVDFRGTLPKTTVISHVNARLAEAAIKGPKHIVDSVDKLTAIIDITGKAESFSTEAPLTPIGRNGILIEGLTVSPQVTPVRVDIDSDVVQKTIEIKPIFVGELPVGITLRGMSIDPASVEIRDPSGIGSLLENLENVYTEPINLAEIQRDTSKAV